jgi:hypothetical protein
MRPLVFKSMDLLVSGGRRREGILKIAGDTRDFFGGRLCGEFFKIRCQPVVAGFCELILFGICVVKSSAFGRFGVRKVEKRWIAPNLRDLSKIA